ncbi:hypothetical protein HMF8227_01091 [Saliniradius amylolyticus]|uniref:Uncharacterized protein n=1 Tax=Saliniradius amylolyticus TaxID=2183582 RepID=A0A2S2E3I7_9ALTE|nr:hypothetical protein HMF8227_01091 [Saliniradius amylolyticus]
MNRVKWSGIVLFLIGVAMIIVASVKINSATAAELTPLSHAQPHRGWR